MKWLRCRLTISYLIWITLSVSSFNPQSSLIDAESAEFFRNSIIVPLLIARIAIGVLLGVGALMVLGGLIGYCCVCKDDKKEKVGQGFSAIVSQAVHLLAVTQHLSCPTLIMLIQFCLVLMLSWYQMAAMATEQGSPASFCMWMGQLLCQIFKYPALAPSQGPYMFQNYVLCCMYTSVLWMLPHLICVTLSPCLATL